MKPFRFRLESVRSLRELAEQKEREALGHAAFALREAEEALSQAQTSYHSLAASLASRCEQTFRAVDQSAGIASLRLAEAEIKRREAKRDEAREARQQAYGSWVESRRALEVIERLAERQKRQHREDTYRAEQAELDEFAGLMAGKESIVS